ncbi:MAG: hypothetical protein JWO30_5007 [Fibrobacteres bacterium]|nr:hypothetical protein [Fibrobacterota bacterium]
MLTLIPESSAAPAGSSGISGFLLTAKEDDVIQARRADREFAYGAYTGLPFVSDMEFRVRNVAFDWIGQRYSLRLEPRGIGEGGASKRFNGILMKQSGQRNRMLLNRALAERYAIVIDMLMKRELQLLYQEMISVSEDKIMVLDKRKTSENFDFNTLIEAEIELSKLKAQNLEAMKEIRVLELRAGQYLKGPFAGFDTTGLVSVDSIIVLAEKGGFTVDTNHVYMDYLELSLDLAESRYRLEKAKGRRFLSFLEFSYDVENRLDEQVRRDEGRDYDLGRAYILEAGFRLPGLTDGNLELNRRKEEFLSEKEDFEEKKRELKNVMEKDIEDIASLISQYRYLKARETEVDAKASLKKYLQLSGVDPLILLSLKASNLRNSIKLEEVKYGLILNYVKVMDATGKLSQAPLRNFLSARNEVLAQ